MLATKEFFKDAIARERAWNMLQPPAGEQRRQMTLLESMPRFAPQYKVDTPADVLVLIESAIRDLDGHVEPVPPRVVPRPPVITEARSTPVAPVVVTADERYAMLQRLAGVEPLTRQPVPLREDKDPEIPAGTHQKLAEALGHVSEKPIGDDIHERLANALRRR